MRNKEETFRLLWFISLLELRFETPNFFAFFSFYDSQFNLLLTYPYNWRMEFIQRRKNALILYRVNKVA